MKLFNGQVFDAVISLGYNCRCAMHLRNHKLRDCSSPFDWLTGASFETRINTICREFEGFLDKGRLDPLDNVVPEGSLKEHDFYEDRDDGYVFKHDFPAGKSFDESYSLVLAKYNRRIARFLTRLRSNESILLIWWGGGYVENRALVGAVRRLNESFPGGRKSLLVIDNVDSGAVSASEVPESDGLLWRISGPFVNCELDMIGDRHLCNEIFKSIRVRGGMRRKVSWGVRRFVIHALIWYLPTKSMRRRFKAYLEPKIMGSFR